MPTPVSPIHQLSWTPQIRQRRATALTSVELANFLVRRVSVEERAIFEQQANIQNLTPQHVDELFPNNVEPIKVFSLDTRFRFQDNQRNYNEDAYCSTMLIPLTPKLQEYLAIYFYPDNIQGGVPNPYRGNPAFKVEHGDTTIVIRKQGWSAFWALVDDVEYTAGFLRFEGQLGF